MENVELNVKSSTFNLEFSTKKDNFFENLGHLRSFKSSCHVKSGHLR